MSTTEPPEPHEPREGSPPEESAAAPDPRADSVPHCYRHPDRETYIRCTRCDRPICPDCMRPAAVGFHCPDDVAEGRRTQRQVRTAFGGRPTMGALVTYVLIGLNVLAYLVERSDVSGVLTRFALIPGPALAGPADVVGVATGEYYRLITAAFLHSPSSLLHILFNMVALYSLGPQLEHVLGRLRFLVLYVLSALGGTAASYAFLPPNGESIGASTAIFGLFAAYIVIGVRRRLDIRPMLGLLGINLVIGFLPGLNIDWHGHLGGLVAGALVSAGMVFAPAGPRRWLLQGLASVGVLAVIVAVVLARTAALTS
ncbi:MAG: rhomboid family intramembrane serine protease [Actinomycetales bacterium]